MSRSIAGTWLRSGVIFSLFFGAGPARAEDPASAPAQTPAQILDGVATWTKGPGTAPLGTQSSLQIPAGYRFAAGRECGKVMEFFENPVDGDELGVIGPDDLNWFVVFEFDDVGYVKDDEKDKLDANALLNSFKEGTESANKQRAARGWAPLELVGWHTPPRYDPQSNNLTWALHHRSEGHDGVNYNTRLLGRHGVMRVTLVCGLDELDQVLPQYSQMMKTHDFNSGNRYAEFRSGDKIAEYGLTALLGAGAVAVALKTGIFQKFGKLIAIAGVAILGVLGKGWSMLFGRKNTETR